jgi:hypothetical protein
MTVSYICEAPTGRLQIHYIKCIHPTQVLLKYYMGNHSFLSGPKEISLHILVTIQATTVPITIYVIEQSIKYN